MTQGGKGLSILIVMTMFIHLFLKLFQKQSTV